MLYHQASAKGEAEAAADLAEVARIFQRIQTDFPESAPASLIAAGGSPGGVDLTRLPPLPTDEFPRSTDPSLLSDLKTILAFLQNHYPETIEALQIDPVSLSEDSAEAFQLRIAYMIAVYVTKGTEVAGDAVIDPKQYMDVLSAMAMDGTLADAAAVFSGQLALDVAEAKLQDVAASVFTDVAMMVPWPEMSPELENMMRAGLDAAFKEGWNLMKAQKDPSVIVGMIFNRLKDVRDIIVATNALNRVQEKALIETTLRIQTAAWIFVNLPDSPGTPDAVRQTLTGLESTASAIVGKDDAKPVAAVFSHGFSALVETYRGNRDGAERFIGYIRQAGAESNIPPLNAVDALLVIANLGQDAPARAANIMIGVTDLADVDAIAPVDVARNASPEAASKPAVSTTPSAWGPEVVVPENHPVWNRRYDRRQDQRSILAGLGVSERAVEFSAAYDPDYLGDAFASEFVDLGNVDLVRMRIGHVAGTSDRLRPSALVNGSVGVMAVRGPGANLAAHFTDSASRKFLRRNPQAIGMYSGVFHRKLPNGGQRFVVLTGLHQACRNCPSIGTAVQFIDFDANGQLLAERNIGLVDDSVAASFDESLSGSEGMTGWERTDFAANPKTLQYRLNMLGYDAGEMDGYPGPQTRQALMEFQVENCLLLSGQPKVETVAKLQKADGLTAECAASHLPGLSANNPLVPGIYVSSPAWCEQEAIPYDVVFDVQRIIRPNFVIFGIEDGLEITRSDIVQGLTQLKGKFHVGNSSSPGTYLIDVISPSSFREMAVGSQKGSTAFFKCANDSNLALAQAPTNAAQSARVVGTGALPVSEGFYTTDPRLCPPEKPETLEEYGAAAAAHQILFANGEYTQFGDSCPISSRDGEDPNVTLNMECMYGETMGIFRFAMTVLDQESFERNGLKFQRCGDNSETEAAMPLPLAKAAVAAAAANSNAVIQGPTSKFAWLTGGGQTPSLWVQRYNGSDAARVLMESASESVDRTTSHTTGNGTSISDLSRESALTLLRGQVWAKSYVAVPDFLAFTVADFNLAAFESTLVQLLSMPEEDLTDTDLAAFSDFGEDKLRQFDPNHLRQWSFLVDIGLPRITREIDRQGYYDSQIYPNAPGDRLLYMNIGGPKQFSDRRDLHEGVPIENYSVESVVGVFQTGPVAEIQFKFSEFSEDSAVVAARAAELGLRELHRVFGVRNGTRFETLSGPIDQRVWTAVFRQYDDGWRLWSVN